MAASVALSAGLRAVTPPTGRERWRRLLHLPRLSFAMGIGFDPLSGFSLFGDRAGWEREAGELEKALESTPEDAAKLGRLGVLYRDLGRPAAAGRTLKQAIAAFRRDGADQAGSPGLICDFAEALTAAGQPAEAERLLRSAAAASPKEWRPRTLLAKLLLSQAMEGLLPPGVPLGNARTGSVLAALLDHRPTPETVEQGRKRVKEAEEQLQRAIQAGPEAAEPREVLASAKSVDGLLGALVRIASGEERDPTMVWKALFTPEALADLQAAARLAPDRPRLVGTAALYAVVAANVEHGMTRLDAMLGASGWSNLPDATRDFVRWALARLEETALTGESRRGAALEVLGLLRLLVVRDTVGAERDLRQALELEAGRDQAWEHLCVLLLGANRFRELAETAGEMVRKRDSARRRLVLIKALELSGLADRALLEAMAAVRAYPEDPMVVLTVAAAAMKARTDDPAGLAQVNLVITRAERMLGEKAPAPLRAAVLLQRGYCLALRDELEEARQAFSQALELDPANDDARKALQALD